MGLINLAYRKYSKNYVRAESLAKSQREGVCGAGLDLEYMKDNIIDKYSEEAEIDD